MGSSRKSWKSRLPPACRPPLIRLTIGSGSRALAVRSRDSATAAARGRGRGMGAGQRHAEDGVGAEARLVRRAVQLAQDAVDARPGPSPCMPTQTRGDRVADVGDGLARRPCRRSASGRRRAARRPRAGRCWPRTARWPGRGRRRGKHLHLDRRIAAAVEDLAGVDVRIDRAHDDSLRCRLRSAHATGYGTPRRPRQHVLPRSRCGRAARAAQSAHRLAFRLLRQVIDRAGAVDPASRQTAK